MEKFSEKINEKNSTSKFKLGIDVHGVIDSLPDVFSFLSNAVVSYGGEVHILTGASWTPELKAELISYGIKWTHEFSIYDFLINSGSAFSGEVEFPDGTIQKKFEDSEWDVIKGNYCKDNNISLHIDDTIIYNEFFSTPFAILWTKSNKPKVNKDIRHMG